MAEPADSTDDRMRQIARLWTQAQPAVSAMTVSMVVDFHAAEDLLGQVAETVVAKFDDYDAARPFVPWALGIARNRVLQHFARRAGDRHVFCDEEVLRILAGAHAETAEEIPRRQMALRACLQKLEGRARLVLELRYVQDMKAAEIARRLGTTDDNVWVLLHRIRRSLAGCVDEALGAPGA